MNNAHIRHAVEEDIEQIVEMGKEFWELTPFTIIGIEYRPDSIAELLQILIEDHYLVVVDSDVGLIGCVGFFIVPFVFNKDYSVAQELFFWVAPSVRGVGSQLLEAVEKDLKDIVDVVAMGELQTSTKLEEFYKKRGYIKTESVYSKVL